MRGARTDLLSTAPVAAAAAVLILLAVAAWPLAALAQAAINSDLVTLLRSDDEFHRAFRWSATLATISSLLGVFFGLASAYCWARLRYPGRTVLRGLSVAPLAIPAVVLATAVQALFAPGTPASNLVSFLGVDPARLHAGMGAAIVTHTLIGTAAVGWLASVAWASVDARKVDAARTLGAGPIWAARIAVLPAVWPAALAGAGMAFLQAMLSYGVIAILATGKETPEGMTVRLALSGDARVTAVAQITGAYALLFGVIAIQFLRSPSLEPRRRRPRYRPRGIDRFGVLVAAAPGLLTLAATIAMVSRAVDAGDGLTATYLRGLITGPQAVATRQAALGSVLAALPAAALTAVWAGVAGAALGRMRGIGGMVRAVGLILPVGLSAAALALGWRLAAPAVDSRITLPLVQAVVAFPLVAGIIARMRPAPRSGMVAAARSLGARRFRAWRVLRGPSYVIAWLVGLFVAFGLALGETGGAAVARVPGGTVPLRLLELNGRGADGEAAALATILLVIAVIAFTLGDPIIARLGRARR